MKILGNIVFINSREIHYGSIEVVDGKVVSITRLDTEHSDAQYITSGFIDSHVHIESSMLTPANFGNLVISRGTVAVVTDPHEIANVMGVEGIEFMVDSAKDSPIKTHFTIPSAVPATPFDRSGGVISAADVESLASSGRFVGLSEMMNVPGVIFGDTEVSAKIATAQAHNLPIDGHAPLLAGDDLVKYCSAGITTDHECSTLEEAREKIALGMKIQIREGSAAKNYDALKSLIATDTKSVLFCTDDSHPDEIISDGHIDKIVRRGVRDGFDIFDLLQIATQNPIEHYGLAQSGIEVGAAADFIVVDNLRDFTTERVYINGELRFDRSVNSKVKVTKTKLINNFNHDKLKLSDLSRSVSTEPINIIGLVEGEIITTLKTYTPKEACDNLESDTSQDIAKIVYINRYYNTPAVVAYCQGFGLKSGAFASSIAHDSHNIIAVGASDTELLKVINATIESRGGLSVCDGDDCHTLPLPIAGIISDKSAAEVASAYDALQQQIAKLGCRLNAPFMTLSFLSLVVIPEVKIGEKGLFSYKKFNWL